MKSMLMMAMGVIALALPLTAQVQNEGLANGIIAARKKNASLMMTYAWNSRTELDKDGAMQDIRVELVNLGPDGKPQRSLLNDQQGKLPGGFLRKRIAEDQRKQSEKFIKGLVPLVEQYTLPSAGAVINFLAGANVQPSTTPQGTTVLQVNGNNVVSQGDTFAMTVDGASLQPLSAQITTQFEGDAVNISASFKTMPSGLNHMQYATVTIPAKNISVNIHNYDYVPNN
jgi:hypothetical protein